MRSEMQPGDSNSPQSPLVPVQPFSLKFALLLTSLIVIVIPVAFFLPLIIGKYLGWSLITDTDILGQNFGSLVLLSQTTGLALTLFLIRSRLRRLKLPWSSLGLKKFRVFQGIRYIVGFFLLMIAFVLILAVAAQSLGIEPPNATINIAQSSSAVNLLESMGSFWMTFILSVIFAPIIEEILFRGVLFPALRNRYGVIAGIIISGALFAIAHIDPIRIIVLIPMGIYLAIMYQRTRSIYPGIILHALWNFMVLMIAQAQLTG